MMRLVFDKGKEPLKILCLGAHCDDIEIGCGGTIMKLIQDFHGDVSVRWVVFSSTPERSKEAKRSAQAFLGRAKEKTIEIGTFRDSYLPYIGSELKESMHQLRRDYSPDVIFTHSGRDLHQDHRLISELTWNAFRDHLILEYEIPKYDGDLGAPNVFVPLKEETCRRKSKRLMTYFRSQNQKSWFTPDLFMSLQRLRGIECNSSSGYAEAFYCRKVVL